MYFNVGEAEACSFLFLVESYLLDQVVYLLDQVVYLLDQVVYLLDQVVYNIITKLLFDNWNHGHNAE